MLIRRSFRARTGVACVDAAHPRIARPDIKSKQRMGRHRWVVERTNEWKNRQRRLHVRDKRAKMFASAASFWAAA